MKQINLAAYDIELVGFSDSGVRDVKRVPYQVRDSVIGIIMGQGLRARDLLDRDDLARKVRDCDTDTLLLEDAEYAKVKEAVEAFPHFSRNDVELVRRLLNPVTVTAKA